MTILLIFAGISGQAMFKRDAIWTVTVQVFSGLAQIVLLSYLSQQLAPSELGALAMMNICIYFATSLQDFGLSSFQIQNQQIQAGDRMTLAVLSCIQSVIVVILLWLSAPLIIIFFEVPILLSLLHWCGILILISSLHSVHQAHLVKQLQLVLLAKIELFSKVVGVALTWVLLIRQPDHIAAVVIGYICSATLKTLLLWILSTATFKPSQNWQLARTALQYGSWQIGTQQLSLLRSHADQLVIGKILGMESLGIYSLAKEIVQYPARFTQPVLQRLLLPRFVISQLDNETLLNKSLTYLLWFNAVLFSAISLLSGLLTDIIFPQQYSNIAELLCGLAVFATIRPAGQIMSPYFQATGQVKKEALLSIAVTIFWIISLLVTFSLSKMIQGLVVMSALQLFISCITYNCLSQNKLLHSTQKFIKIVTIPVLMVMLFSGFSYYMLASV